MQFFLAGAICLILRRCPSSQGVAGFALTLTFSSGRIAAHRANFSAGAICLILRSCGCGVAERGAECRTFFGVAGFAPKPNFEQWSHRSPPCNFFSASAFCKLQLILRRCGSGVGVADAMKLKAKRI